ncbi:PelD GGDEF domain-containing protein [Pseudomonas lundensis]|uniref:Sugar transporter n=1 Tax=Pseudomonas lundensis TaxID=86185 RepID=A0AAX2H7V7_9PSED|nr:PelD GGDEF domain-containing protein [Pseudomonas lundensis]SOB52467.1 Sugar transporter [Pseudomonas lundensis]
MNSPHMDFSLAPRTQGFGSWLETLVITALALGLGLWLTPDDPLQVRGEFPWPLLAPLLISVRYGFVRGVSSACLIVMAFFILRQQGWPLYAEISPSFIVGILVCTMVVGEVRDLWDRRLQRLQMANNYRQYRLDEFTRHHQVLRVSHDRLEQRVAGSDQSLRSSLLGLRERLRTLQGTPQPLVALAEPIVAILGQYGSLRVAGLYPVDAQRRVQDEPLATLGVMGPLSVHDPLITLCLERNELVSVRSNLTDNGEQSDFSSLQVCVPLMDTEGRLLAILAVRQMPFFAFQERTLSLLALLAGHIADLLSSDHLSLQLPDADAQHFAQQLKRSLIDVQQHDLSACLFFFELTEPNPPLLSLFERSQRGLDLQLNVRNQRDHDGLLVLLPLTSAEGAEGYLTRLNTLVHEHFGQQHTLQSLGVRAFAYTLEPACERGGLRNFLFNECGLNDQQVAI